MSDIKRLSELDGLRAVAAIIVVLYHFTSRWDDYLPYGSAIQPMTQFGFLGVNLFFIISGFVIFMSLERSPSVWAFIRHRAIRLVPAMVVCSIVTFAVMWLLDTPFTETRREHWTGFIPSWTFTPPRIWQFIAPVGGWMDKVYWTLYVEVKFYAIAAFLYFFQGHRFFRPAFLVLLVAGAVAEYLTASSTPLSLLVEHLLFPAYLPFFCAGIALYDVYRRRSSAATVAMLGLSLLLAMMAMSGPIAAAIVMGFFAIFFVVIFRPSWVSWLSHPVVYTVGLASYPLYLVHQNVGVAFMTAIPRGIISAWYYPIMLVTIISIVLFSIVVHVWVEAPVARYFRRRERADKHAGAT